MKKADNYDRLVQSGSAAFQKPEMAKTSLTEKYIGEPSFSFLAVIVGVIAGLGAVVFRSLISIFHNLLFFGNFSLSYNTSAHSVPSRWGLFVILVPVAGAICVAFLVQNFAREAGGPGVLQVIKAIYYDKGKIRPAVAAIKPLASAISIGSGAAVGREGPIIQIGAVFGSFFGQISRMSTSQRLTLIAAGASGGIAATFNTPIGALLFTVEILLHEISVRTLVPVAISTATAGYIGRLFLGDHPSFLIPTFETVNFRITSPEVLFSYLGLGILMGVVSALFIRYVYSIENFFDTHVRGGYYVRHTIGMLIVGILMYSLFLSSGHYYIEGVGYSTIQDILTGDMMPAYLLLILFALKMLAVSLSLGTGASGGIFSPALFMGATLGAAYGSVLGSFFQDLHINPAAYAVVGMAAVVGGSTGAAMAAIVMSFEMTLDYNVIIPLTIAVVLSYGIRKVLAKESIYTWKLVMQGYMVPHKLQRNAMVLDQVKDLMETRFDVIESSATLESLRKTVLRDERIQFYLISEQERIIGVIPKDEALQVCRYSEKIATLKDVSKPYFHVTAETRVVEVINKMRDSGISLVLVVSKPEKVTEKSVLGYLTKEHLADSLLEASEFFS
jgi:CIC family chloride channel protein